jgi:hypothetical protein
VSSVPRGLVVPLQLNADGSFVTTEDPAQIMRQRIIDILVTNRWERIHRVDWGADLASFMFTNIVVHILGAKADELKTLLNAELTFGEVVQLRMVPLQGAESAVAIQVLFRVFEGGEMEEIREVFTNPNGGGVA